jgi:hypothetical protein
MERAAISYLLESFRILKENHNLIILPIVGGIAILFSGYLPDWMGPPSVFVIHIFLILVIPIIYGQIFEIIYNGQRRNWPDIFKKYWIKIILISIILKLPELILTISEMKLVGVKEITSYAVAIGTVYVLPIVLIRREALGSISLGVKCLIGNLKYSIPLCVAVIIPEVFLSIMSIAAINLSMLVCNLLLVVAIFLTVLADYSVFIAAGLILKDKVF